ncbi:peptidase C26 family protein [Pelomyxa schiedti]|nr:peptidase C26 family protein [Pelomyxa schiedti]
MGCRLSWLLFWICCLGVVTVIGGGTTRPIVGIITQPESDPTLTPYGDQSISAGYVKWLESAGLRVAVIPYNMDFVDMDILLAGLNGVLFPGGGTSLAMNSTFMQATKHIYDSAIASFDSGDPFPIWGTCLGFEILCILTANDESVLQYDAYDAENLALPLALTPEYSTSILLGNAPVDVIEALSGQASTMNLHVNGIIPDVFYSNQALTNMYTVLSTNVDRQGLPFVSTMEGKKYPFFGTQWHGERNLYEWDLPENLDHSYLASKAMNYVAQAFASQVRNSRHFFASQDYEQSVLIYNYSPVFTGDDPYQSYPDQQIYMFSSP